MNGTAQKHKAMKKEYDFSKSMPNPYTKAIAEQNIDSPKRAKKARKKQISINLNVETIEYFKDMANKQGVPYQNLMNIFLNQCVQKKLEIKI